MIPHSIKYQILSKYLERTTTLPPIRRKMNLKKPSFFFKFNEKTTIRLYVSELSSTAITSMLTKYKCHINSCVFITEMLMQCMSWNNFNCFALLQLSCEIELKLQVDTRREHRCATDDDEVLTKESAITVNRHCHCSCYYL